MVDPLVLDLDGDGLEITPLSRGVQFDGNGDTIRTNTSWIDADDGLLVLDRNGNGAIDSGRELFGDETLLADGKKAAHGFAALSELDVGGAANATGGAGDGLFDAKDAQYTNVRIWRDLNQDGISQAGEMQTLAEAGIASVKLSSTKTETSFGDAQLVQSGSFTRTDGSEGQAGSFILAQNNAVTTHAPIAISAEAAALPTIQGSGWVRGIQEAATLNPGLLGLYAQAQGAGSRAGYAGSISEMLLEWGGHSDYRTASKVAMEEDNVGLILRNPESEQELAWVDMAVKADRETRETFRSTLTQENRIEFDAMRLSMVGKLEKLYTYEAFTGYTFLRWSDIEPRYQPPVESAANGRPVTVDTPLSQVIQEKAYGKDAILPGYRIVVIPEPLVGKPHIDMLWDRLVDDATINLMPTMRLSQYADMVQLNVSEAGVQLDFSQMNAALDSATAANAHEGSALFLDVYRTYGEVFKSAGWDGAQRLRVLVQASAGSQAIKDAFTATGSNLVATTATEGTANDDNYVGDSGANSFNAGAGNDFIDGLAGNDSLIGEMGDDVLFGGEGDDNLYGGDGVDVLNGGDGADYLEGGAGADTLDAGAGNDIVHGGLGNNTYLFGKGDGQDRVYYYADSAADKLNTVQFKEGVLASEISLKQVHDTQTGSITALEVSIAGTTDNVVINGFFTNNTPANANNPVQQFRFADGSIWDLTAIMAKLFEGTALADTINGTPGNDTISGAGGNDNLYGGDGADVLNGGDGADYLEGGAGADTLDAGAGNDIVHGGLGNNTYLFGKGDGQDRVYYYADSAADKLNTVQFKEGVLASEISLKQVHDTQTGSITALEVSIAGTTDNVVINGFFTNNTPANANNPVQQFRFADGSIWDLAAIASKLSGGTEGNDTINGTPGNDTISGAGGNDNLYGGDGVDVLNGGDGADYLEGGAGADTLDAGAGNDIVHGGLGNNTYLFGKGDGQDRVYYYADSAADKLNTVQFKEGVLASEISLKQVHDTQTGSITALEVSIAGTTDNVVINGFFTNNTPANANNPVQQFRFADGSIWDLTAIMAKLFEGTALADTINGTPGNDTISGAGGNDNLYGGDGADVLNGGDGADYLEGGAGADTLDAGAGNDIVHGGLGNNTYLFGKGDGQDRVYYYADSAADKLNTVQFKEGVLASEISLKQVHDTQTGSITALEVSIAGTTDNVVINGFFTNNTPANANNPVQQFRFADGSIWDLAAIASKLSGGTEGNDTINGTPGNDTISGAGGNDNLYGGDGVDVLNGGDGADYLEGGAGADTLDAGAGNDIVHGGLGNNTYLFGKGDGQDRVYYYADSAADKLNTVQFKEGVLASEISLKQVHDTQTGSITALEVSIAGTTDNVVINGFFTNNTPANANNPVQQFRFADGTTWDLAAIASKLSGGTEGNDTINGTPGNDTISGAGGNDNLYGGDGADVLNGGDGADYLEGGAGADTLDAGAGNDIVHGGLGNNTYLFGKGDGQDRVYYYADSAADKLNTVQFKEGVLASEISLKQVHDTQTGSITALEVSIAGTTDNVVINGFFTNNTPANANNPVQQFRFADGSIWDLTAIMAKLFEGTALADTINGTPGNDTISGAGGNDNLYGGDGVDVLNGGDGADYLEGGAGADTLDAGAGNDIVHGGLGNNTYLFGKGDGQDRVYYYADSAADKLNTVQFKEGVLASEISLKQVHDTQTGSITALEVSIAGTTDNVVINGFFTNNTPANANNPVQQFRFADGSIWDLTAIMAKLFEGTALADTINGTPGNDTISGAGGNDNLYGGDGADVLNGGDGADYLEGGAGADTLDAGAGNDIVHGGLGNNTYLFGKGDGQDRVYYYADSAADKLNTVQFKEGVLASEISLKQVHDTQTGSITALEVSIAGTTDNVVINGFFTNNTPANANNPVQQFRFADGSIWDLAAIASKLSGGTEGNDTINGTPGNDTISGAGGNDNLYGGDGVDVLNGGDGADYLEGGAGADTLDAGAGNDIVHGGLGNNTYLFGKGDGQDRVYYYADSAADKLNTVQFKEGVLASEISLKQVHDTQTGSITALEVSIAGTTDNVVINGFFTNNTPANANNPVQQFRFADGSIWDLTAIMAKLFEGTALADTINGTPGNDTISGAGGNDNLYGLVGDDVLNGGEGNDNLYGGDGVDVLNGGDGADYLEGGVGNDTYLFGLSADADTINDYDVTSGNTDVLAIGAGVATDQLWFRRVGYDLEVSVIGTDDKSTISNWYSSSGYHIEQFKTSDGKVLTDAKVQALVDAMAAFSPPSAGQTTMPSTYQANLTPVIAANWQ